MPPALSLDRFPDIRQMVLFSRFPQAFYYCLMLQRRQRPLPGFET
nr:MAG TPA: hypothetical protein [Caudoviricetes sp.]DAE79999.1 MAG TPA: hypothetical protein [Caudoviricetes sp.]